MSVSSCGSRCLFGAFVCFFIFSFSDEGVGLFFCLVCVMIFSDVPEFWLVEKSVICVTDEIFNESKMS